MRDIALETILSKIKAADLPQLTWTKGGSKPAVLEQWLQSMGMEIGGLHYLLEVFWTRAVKVVKYAHFAYLSKGPLQRHEIRPLQPDSLVFDVTESIVFRCIEMRLRSLLLNVIPTTSKAMCLSTEQTSTTDILFVVVVEAGPGTHTDKDVVLEKVSKGSDGQREKLLEGSQRLEICLQQAHNIRRTTARSASTTDSDQKDQRQPDQSRCRSDSQILRIPGE